LKRFVTGNIVRDRMDGLGMGGEERCLHGVVGEPERNIPIARPECR
jgi:hypothetical protein